MYEKFENLINSKGITSYQVARGTGISPSTFSDWKSGRSKPKVDKLQLIAAFLNVPLECLLDDIEKSDEYLPF